MSSSKFLAAVTTALTSLISSTKDSDSLFISTPHSSFKSAIASRSSFDKDANDWFNNLGSVSTPTISAESTREGHSLSTRVFATTSASAWTSVNCLPYSSELLSVSASQERTLLVGKSGRHFHLFYHCVIINLCKFNKTSSRQALMYWLAC